jgi:hypothetical protein
MKKFLRIFLATYLNHVYKCEDLFQKIIESATTKKIPKIHNSVKFCTRKHCFIPEKNTPKEVG